MYYNFYGVNKGRRSLEEIDEFYHDMKRNEEIVKIKFIDGTSDDVILTNVVEGMAEKRCQFLNSILEILKSN